jgi:hypothetical protein
MDQSVTHLTYNGSNLCQDTNFRFFYFSSFPPDKFRYTGMLVSRSCDDRLLPNPFQFISHPTIGPRYLDRCSEGPTVGVRFPEGARVFFFTASGPALGLNQPSTQWVPQALSPGLNIRSLKLTTHLHLMPRSGMVELYLHTLMSPWHGA